jgi:hypothetical protein
MAASSVADLAAIVKRFESGGDYGAQNPHTTASGAYQFINPTWRSYAGQIGVDTGQYPTAGSAPPEVQDAVFAQAVKNRGLGDWTCPGCNPRLSAYVTGQQTDTSPQGPGGVAPPAAPPVDMAAAPQAAPATAASSASPDVDPRLLAAMSSAPSVGDSPLVNTMTAQQPMPPPARLVPGARLALAQRLA